MGNGERHGNLGIYKILILEIITTFSATCVIIVHLFEKKPVKRFFSKTLPLFLCGTTTLENKKVRGFRALKADKEQYECTQNIIKTIAPNYNNEEFLVLNKEELFKFLQDSNVFTKIQIRK